MTTSFALDYLYDHIGNRRIYDKNDSGTHTTYERNDLNQYTSTANPSENFNYYDPPTQTTAVDGNLTQDGTFTYTWDAENRLVEVQTRPEAGPNPTAYEVDDKHVYFTYDYMGRRVRKRVGTYNGSSWPETSDELFLYDGWNVVMVIDANATDVNATAAITRKYTWGLDLSGTTQGAGGIGGLLACVETQGDHQGSYWYFYDANGNVGQLIRYVSSPTETLTIAGHYEYAPYGNTVVVNNDVRQPDGTLITANGGYALANPIRFSTKWFDPETGLGYWGYRYYSPRLGRWISRDPIGEEGSTNLLMFVHNSPAVRHDPNGLCDLLTYKTFGPYTEMCGWPGSSWRLCNDCKRCIMGGAFNSDSSTWTTKWTQHSKPCTGWGKPPVGVPAACPLNPPLTAALKQCRAFLNGAKKALNCQGCCDLMWAGQIGHLFPTYNDCYAHCTKKWPP